jgi:PAS domain S-box-containing protein
MKERDDWHLTDLVDHETGRGDPFAAAVRGTRMPMCITDPRQPDNPIVFANQAFHDLTGYSREEIIGRNCRFLQGPATDPATSKTIRQAIAAERAISIDILNYRKDGTTYWNALYISPVHGEDDRAQFFFASQVDCTDRIEAQQRVAEQKAEIERQVASRTAELERALEAKSVLLHEVDHRVKNNLTMIGALLRLQARTLPDPALRATLETMLERVDALASVHRRLYQADDISRFDLGAFARSLAEDVIGASGRRDIALVLDVTATDIPANKAAPAGLILNELITNAIKHAYADGRSGTLCLMVRPEGAMARMELRDDGPGFDPDAPRLGSVGRKLVERLSRQIAAETIWRSAAAGTDVTVIFPLNE